MSLRTLVETIFKVMAGLYKYICWERGVWVGHLRRFVNSELSYLTGTIAAAQNFVHSISPSTYIENFEIDCNSFAISVPMSDL